MHITVNDVACLITAKFSLFMPYLRPKSRLPRRWSVYRMQLLQSLDAERRWPSFNTEHGGRVLHTGRGAARVAFLVGLVMGLI